MMDEVLAAAASSADPHAWPPLRTFAAFAVVATASSTLSEWTRKTLRLPLITGYILGGILCGPYVVAILTRPESIQLAHLVTDDAMGFIGFSAGSKFLLSELSGSLRQVLTLLFGLVSVTYVLVLSGLAIAAPWLPITADAPPDKVLSIALIIACLAVARSPSSAIALVSELSAHGTFTTAALSVTVLMDVVVVLLFALTLLVVHAIHPSPGAESPSVSAVLGLFGLQMLISAVVGVLLGYLLHAFISCTSRGVSAAVEGHQSHQADGSSAAALDGVAPTPPPSPPDAPALNGSSPKRAGGVSFSASAGVPPPAGGASSTAAHPPARLRRFNSVIAASAHGGSASAAAAVALDSVQKEASGALFMAPEAARARKAAVAAALWLALKLALNVAESLVMQLCGFEIFETEGWEEANFGMSFHQPLVISMTAGFIVVNFTASRKPFLRILHDSSEPVYIAFFTLTGMTLQLDALLPNLPTAALIFTLRFTGIAIGSYWGGRLGGSLPEHYNRYWMAFITQAGVALGLAQRVAGEFPYGPALALCVTAEVVVNQLVGPLLFKAAIIAVGEAHNEYSPADSHAKLGVTPPSRPKPRSAVVVAPAADAEAAALVGRLKQRGWQVAQCDAAFTLDSVASTAAGGDEPAPYTPARRAARLEKLTEHTTDPALLRLIKALGGSLAAATPAAAAAAKVAAKQSRFGALLGRSPTPGTALAEPLLTVDEEAATPATLMELALLYAVCSLESLDVVVLLLPSDEAALDVMHTLQTSSSLLSSVHERQTSTPQLLVRVRDAAGTLRLRASVAQHSPAYFALTPVAATAALPNLVAEVLHPDAHWSLQLDNDM